MRSGSTSIATGERKARRPPTRRGRPMSTIDRPEPRLLPPLVAGQRLDQPTFHERYEAMPPETWAELIGGVVHMPSPLRSDHGATSEDVAGWLFLYRRATPGISGAGNATTKLGDFGE